MFFSTDFSNGNYDATQQTMMANMSFGPTTKTLTIQNLKATVFLAAPAGTIPPLMYQIAVYANTMGYPLNDQFVCSGTFWPSAQGQTIELVSNPITMTGSEFYFLLFRSTAAELATHDNQQMVPFGQSVSNEYAVFMEMQYTEGASSTAPVD